MLVVGGRPGGHSMLLVSGSLPRVRDDPGDIPVTIGSITCNVLDRNWGTFGRVQVDPDKSVQVTYWLDDVWPISVRVDVMRLSGSVHVG